MMNKQEIRTILSRPLPGKMAQSKMLPLGRVLEVPDSLSDTVTWSSVLLLLFNGAEGLTACLIKRPKHMKHHAGQIAMPGGKVEQNETYMETALRETFEEIGIPSGKIEILGSLSDLYIEVSQFMVHPIVGWLNHEPSFKPNPQEVDEIILFPLSLYSLGLSSVKMDTITGKLEVPVIRFENEVIWGATAMILSEFMEALTAH